MNRNSSIMELLLLCLSIAVVRGSTPADPHYVAAVLEYSYDSSSQANLDNYVQYIEQAAREEADIVVFPEMTLLRGGDALSIPIYGLLKEFPTPALRPDLYHNALVELSRAALQGGVYVVVNVQEELDCSSAQPAEETCPDTQIYRFNTNVVFDRNGSVIDRYRKINLFGEYSRTPAFSPQLGVFHTDFGVTFGHFICFDLMFQVPAVQIVQKHNITDVIFTTMWFSEMPFLTAVEIQEAYSYTNNVNFLASGASRVAVGSAGSGIYSGKAGALISTMPGVDTRMMLVSKVPKIPGEVQDITYPGPIPNDPKVMDGLLLKRDLSLPAHATRVVQLTEELQQFQLTDGEVTCSFRIQLRDLNNTGDQAHWRYRALARDGVVTYARREAGVSACAVLACVNDDVTTCAQRSLNTTSKYEFTTLIVIQQSQKPRRNETLQCADVAYYPTTLKSDKFPMETSAFTYDVEEVTQSIYHEEKDHQKKDNEDNEEKDKKVNEDKDKEVNEEKQKEDNEEKDKEEKSSEIRIVLSLLVPQRDVLTFGIWGRIFDRDVDSRNEADDIEKEEFENLENGLL